MIFGIDRVSGYQDKPCDEAFKEDDKWFVEIKTLEELIDFKNKYGKIILFKNDNLLWIYDGWIE